MANGNVVENKLLDWIGVARAQLEAAAANLETAQEEFDKATSVMEAIAQVLEFGRSLEQGQADDMIGIPLTEIVQQKSHMDALKLIAKHRGGMVKTSEAANILRASGRSKAKQRSLYSNLYHLMTDSNQWEADGKGAFKLNWHWGQGQEEFPIGEVESDSDELTIRRDAISHPSNRR